MQSTPAVNPIQRLVALAFRPPWRVFSVIALVAGFLWVGFVMWSPGYSGEPGRFDLGRNGIWAQHGWLGDDAWFDRNQRDRGKFRSDAAVDKFAATLAEHHIGYVFPHLCPCSNEGEIPAVDPEQTARFLSRIGEVEVLPWIGGVLGQHVFLDDPAWRRRFVTSAVNLLKSHERLAGINLNIEPLPSGDENYLLLLKELQQALPPGKKLSISAYPPVTMLHPSKEVHWDEDFFRKVAAESDQLTVMMYDTALSFEKPYIWLMRRWTAQILDWAGDKEVLLGVPCYDDEGVGYHHPKVENLTTALSGIQAGLERDTPLPENYAGVVLYSDWEMDAAEWNEFSLNFLRRSPGPVAK